MVAPARHFGGSLGAVLVLAQFLSAGDWPHWRGPERNDITTESSGWSNGKWLPEKPAWTAKVGAGASSPLVVDDCVYALGWTDSKDLLRCLDVRNGTERWAVSHDAQEYGR